jgi:hypothetical protein
MFIFKYIKKSDNSLIGYHLDTFCSIGGDKKDAKHYKCVANSVEEQKEIISNNFQYVMKDREKNSKYLKGLNFEDVIIEAEEVPDVEIVYSLSKVDLNSEGEIVVTQL